jgi:hypothetical protein
LAFKSDADETFRSFGTLKGREDIIALLIKDFDDLLHNIFPEYFPLKEQLERRSDSEKAVLEVQTQEKLIIAKESTGCYLFFVLDALKNYNMLRIKLRILFLILLFIK